MSSVVPTSRLNDRRKLRAASSLHSGEVALVGAGPGDPELLTLKALRFMEAAEIVFYDALVSEDVLDLLPPDAELIYVGKRKAAHAVPQTEIIERMIAAARQGLKVLRLKGGDPFIFGRGGEEVEALQAAGVNVVVAPGISSALGCAASAKIPLTHRDCAQSVSFITGHAKAGEPEIDWRAHAAANQTLVIFMGVGTAGRTAENLIAAGRDALTPVAIIENGTRPDQRVVRTHLSALNADIETAGVHGPALLIIGEVARKASDALNTLIAEVAA